MALPWAALSAVILSATLFSAKGILIKLAYPYGVSANALQLWRMVFAVPFFIVVTWRRWPAVRHEWRGWSDFWWLGLLGLMGYYFASWLDFQGLQYVSAGLERMIIYLYPTMVLLLKSWMSARWPSTRQWVAMGLSYAGILSFYAGDADLSGGQVELGAALVFGSAALFAVYVVLNERVVQRFGSLWATSVSMLFATLGMTVHSVLAEGLPTLDHPWPVWVYALLIGVFGTVVPSLALYWGISKIGAERASATAMSGPVVTLVLGWAFLGETVGLGELSGTVAILAGVALLNWKRPA